MAYADQSMSSRRVVAIVIVALLHALLGYAFITGLAYNVIKKAAQDLKTFDVAEEKPPEPQAPPPPPPPEKFTPPPIVSPPPIVQIQQPIQQSIVSVPNPPPAPVIHEAAPVAPPKPSVASPAKLKGDANFGISDEDYPPAAQRNGEEGVVTASFVIDPTGRVQSCEIVKSSGSSTLDTTTCTLITRRARYKPAQDAAGNPLSSTMSRSIRWQIPKD